MEEKNLKEIKNVKGMIEFKNVDFSYSNEKLLENLNAFVSVILRSKPATVKGTYVKSISLSSTMGPGIKVDTNSFDN